MRNRIWLTIGGSMLMMIATAQSKRYDSSMKVGKAGYRVHTHNKHEDKNPVTITPLGFENNPREATIEVRGRVVKSEVDDLNRDGFPDLVIYISGAGLNNAGSVIGIRSENNEGMAPIIFPDITDDPKLRTGYRGNDQFSLLNGVLMRRFPLYETSDTAQLKPSGMIRQIMYSVVPDERGMQKFKAIRSYDFAKQ